MFRLYLGAGIGSLASLLIFLENTPIMVGSILQFIIGAVAVVVAFEEKKGLASLVRIGAFYGVGVSFTGAMFVFSKVCQNTPLFLYHGILYLDISPMVLIGSLAVGYGITKTVITLSSIASPAESECTVTIVTKGGIVSLTGLIDTGNKLTEPFSGFPVVVVKPSAIGGILPVFFRQKDRRSMTEGIRIIPFYSIGGTGVMYGFRPERLEIRTKEETITTDQVYIAVDEGLNGEEYAGAIVSILCFKEGELNYGFAR